MNDTLTSESIAALLNAVSATLENEEGIEKILNKSDDYQEFNLFSVLRVENKELHHSRILAELLNPKGKHGAEDFFLKKLLSVLEMNSKWQEQWLQVKVTLEEKLMKTAEGKGLGRADIMLEFDSKFCIIIENKIYAKDQDIQLDRYRTYLKTKYSDEHKLVYLTLDGRPSPSYPDAAFYTCLSYKNDIRAWLHEALAPESEISFTDEAKFAVKQYLSTIERLTGQVMLTPSETQKLRDLLNGNPDLLKTAMVLADSKILEEVKQEKILNFTKLLGKIDFYIGEFGKEVEYYKCPEYCEISIPSDYIDETEALDQFINENSNILTFTKDNDTYCVSFEKSACYNFFTEPLETTQIYRFFQALSNL